MEECPVYLKSYEALWNNNHKAAVLKWFSEAKYGMFIHYGLYSLSEDHEWAMYHKKITPSEYALRRDSFTAEIFDADKITDLAISAGMKYITFTTCHHESFCLFDSKVEPFNSVNSPCGRDLVKELSEACDKKGLGFFAYYTFMLNWRHPYYVTRKEFLHARPDYDAQPPEYLYREKNDFKKYLDYIMKVIDEIASNYKLSGLWFDLIAAYYYMGDEYIPIDDIYKQIREKHPELLISFKQGATGTEDFASCEGSYKSQEDGMRREVGEIGAQRAKKAFELNKNKHNEVCTTIQRHSWGYDSSDETKTVPELLEVYKSAQKSNCNLLLNIGPRGDGSIPREFEERLISLKREIDNLRERAENTDGLAGA